MKHQKELEAILEFILNGEFEDADKIMHNIVVETASDIYNNIVETEEDELGGDPSDSFVDDVTVDPESGFEDDLDSDVEGSEEDELSVEDRVEELEDSLEALRAEFDRLLDVEEEEHDTDFDNDGFTGEPEGDVDSEFGDEFEESLTMEATNLSNKANVNMSSEEGNVNKKSVVANTKKSIDSVKPHNIGSTSEEKGAGKVSAKDENAEDNINVPEKKVSKPEGKEKGDVNTKSTLGQ